VRQHIHVLPHTEFSEPGHQPPIILHSKWGASPTPNESDEIKRPSFAVKITEWGGIFASPCYQYFI
jgi:hypothetical protein